MVRHLLAAASVLVLMSGAAFAEMDDLGSKMITIHRSGPHDVGASRTVTKRHLDRYGNIVTKSKTYTGGFSGSSVPPRRPVTEPDIEITRSRTVIER